MYLSKFVLFIHSDISKYAKRLFLPCIDRNSLFILNWFNFFIKFYTFLKWDEIYFPETCNSCSLQIDKI